MKQRRYFEARQFADYSREKDIRTPYQRDRARILHSASFRRLQGKTQVMGPSESDIHRTRLTHSIECAQIGRGILSVLEKTYAKNPTLVKWFPNADLIEAACLAHDLGHPPFGHGGEKALHKAMLGDGGFEGNGQTLRILARLEKHGIFGQGINPSRRLVLSVLKYPVAYSDFDECKFHDKPPKCYLNEEKEIVEWAVQGFTSSDRHELKVLDTKDKAANRTLDCSIMELADDIAYGVHDLEDICGRHVAEQSKIESEIESLFEYLGGEVAFGDYVLNSSKLMSGLFGQNISKKQMVGQLVNSFITSAKVYEYSNFVHPLLKYRADLSEEHRAFLDGLKAMAFKLVVDTPQVQQLEFRGQRVVSELFNEMSKAPEKLIPAHSRKVAKVTDSQSRLVCDYIAGMTDSYATKIYRRLFVPGWGTSSDEL